MWQSDDDNPFSGTPRSAPVLDDPTLFDRDDVPRSLAELGFVPGAAAAGRAISPGDAGRTASYWVGQIVDVEAMAAFECVSGSDADWARHALDRLDELTDAGLVGADRIRGMLRDRRAAVGLGDDGWAPGAAGAGYRAVHGGHGAKADWLF
jgi:hypothetical protein